MMPLSLTSSYAIPFTLYWSSCTGLLTPVPFTSSCCSLLILKLKFQFHREGFCNQFAQGNLSPLPPKRTFSYNKNVIILYICPIFFLLKAHITVCGLSFFCLSYQKLHEGISCSIFYSYHQPQHLELGRISAAFVELMKVLQVFANVKLNFL